ncbi:MAG: DUF1361 domain-containing protein [Eubacteriaceae bacterium]
MIIDKKTKVFMGYFIAYILVSIPIFIHSKNFIHIALIWNLFLAILPLIFAKILQNTQKNINKLKQISLSFLWLFFFPNSPYIITDFIHISGINFYWKEYPYSSIIYSKEIIYWVEIIHMGFAAIFGTLMGLLSMFIIHQILLIKFKNIFANSIIVMVCFLSGYGVYIGRFLRFNSWDILQPIKLLSQLSNNLDYFSLNFSLFFGIYILASYYLFYVIHKNSH